MSTKIF